MHNRITSGTFAIILLATPLPGKASMLGVSPVRVDVAAPGNSAEVRIDNPDAIPMNAQIRLFKWSLTNGADDYQETDDVVVTPPIAELPPGGTATVRIVRTTKAPVSGEESYRLVIDQIPDANRVVNMGLTISTRYTLPVFFVGGDASQPRLHWSLRQTGGKSLLIARNDSDKHARIANLRVGAVNVARGLAGYVLGHRERAWQVPASVSKGRVTAESDAGHIDSPLGHKE